MQSCFQSPALIENTMVPLIILADPAYTLLKWLIKPFIGNLSAQVPFNCYHSNARVVVEQAFGRLKSRWRIIGKKIEADIRFAPKIVAACCILHNICENGNCSLGECVSDAAPFQLPQPQKRPSSEATADGHQVRNALLRYVTNELPQRMSSVLG